MFNVVQINVFDGSVFLPELKVLPVSFSCLPLLLLGVVVVGGVDGLDLHVTAVTQTDVRHVVGVQLEVFLRGLKKHKT